MLTRPAAVKAENFADPAAFRPQRWLGREAGAHEPSVHIPFGSGPRICPGRVHALLEMKMLLAMLYKTFDVERAGDANSVREKNAFVMTPVGVRVRLRRRSRAEAVSRGEMRALRPSAPVAPAAAGSDFSRN